MSVLARLLPNGRRFCKTVVRRSCRRGVMRMNASGAAIVRIAGVGHAGKVPRWMPRSLSSKPAK